MRHQTSTHIGIYSIFGGFLNVFEDTKLQDFRQVFSSLTFGELFSILIPFAIGIWAILHDEDNLDTYKASGVNKISRDDGDESNDSRKQGRQRVDGASIKIPD